MRDKFRAALVAGCLVVSAFVAVAPEGAASTGAGTADGPATIAGIGRATQIKEQYPGVWVHFRPTLDSPAVEIRRSGSDVATICYDFVGNRYWDVIYDHTTKRVGYTYEEYLTVASLQKCSNVGQAADDGVGQVWVHLYPRADWAHEVIHLSHDIARICFMPFWHDPSDGSTRNWGLFLDHDNKVVGFTWDDAVPGPSTAPRCD